MRGKEAALFGAAPATKGPLKGRRTMGGGQGQLRPGPVTHTLLISGSREFPGDFSHHLPPQGDG